MRKLVAFCSILSGMYTIRAMWNHGRFREAAALAVAGTVAAILDLQDLA